MDLDLVDREARPRRPRGARHGAAAARGGFDAGRGRKLPARDDGGHREAGRVLSTFRPTCPRSPSQPPRSSVARAPPRPGGDAAAGGLRSTRARARGVHPPRGQGRGRAPLEPPRHTFTGAAVRTEADAQDDRTPSERQEEAGPAGPEAGRRMRPAQTRWLAAPPQSSPGALALWRSWRPWRPWRPARCLSIRSTALRASQRTTIEPWAVNAYLL